MFLVARYGTSTTIRFPVVKRAVVDLAASADWTPATGDTKISKDGGNVANTTNNPSAVGGTGSVLWTLTLTNTEMQADEVVVQIVDSATKAIEDQVLIIRTVAPATYDTLYSRNVNPFALALAPVILSQASQAFDSDATSHNVTMPSTVHKGDGLVVVFANDGSASVTTPANWTLLDSTANSTIVRLSSYIKIADGTEGGTTVDFVTSATEQGSAIVIRLQGGTFFPDVTILGVNDGTAATGTSTTPDPPSVTSPWEAANSLVLAIYGSDDQSQATDYPASYTNGITKQGANITGASCGVASRVIAATSENPGTFTIASQEWIAETIIIRPASIRDAIVNDQTQFAGANIANLPDGVKKNTAYNNFCFLMVDSTDHITAKTGLTVTATRSIDGAAFASCTNSVSEVSDGIYKINLSTSDLNGDSIVLKFTATGADTRLVAIKTET